MRKMLNVVFVAVACLMVVLLLGVMGWYETHYTVKAKIVRVANETVTVEDSEGECWIFYTDGDYEVNEVVKLTMDNNTTLSIYDDEIEKVEKVF